MTGGLRERKKRATQRAIETSAVDLALEHGYPNVTVEMICDRAMISQRTFFNYVGSKEHAVLGIEPPLPDERRRAAYIAGTGGSPLSDLIAMIVEVFAEVSGGDPTLLRKRRQVIHANPPLLIREFDRIEETQVQVVDLVVRRLRSDDHGREDTELLSEARMVVSLTFGIMHFFMREWRDDDFHPDVEAGIGRAVELARRVAGA